MKFRLVEVLEQPFNETIEIEYDAADVCSEDDEGKVSGQIIIQVKPSDIVYYMWEFMTEDHVNPPLTEQEFELFAEDDDAYETYLKTNFDSLYKKYETNFYEEFKDEAKEHLYSNWENYSDSKPFSQSEEDRKNFWRDVFSK